ncbi:MAG: helix-turn-helix transcriptional regulator [Rhizobium sp.]
MGEINRITIDGKDYVLIPEADYEDLLDIADARAVRARIDAGEETWPTDVVNALVAGENPVRIFRKHRGLTMAELAEKTGLSQPYLSEIETGKKSGSIEALKAVASVLMLSLDDLT